MLKKINLLAAILYCVVGHWLSPNITVAGDSGWWIILFGYFAVK